MFSSSLSACPIEPPEWSKVEKRFLSESGRQPTYPHEYIPVLEARNPYQLGQLAALRFIEWVIDNPKGVVSLSSGNTPEFFIKYLAYYKKNWHQAEVQTELHKYGIKHKDFPDTSNLKFVQIEEYYPMSASHYKKVSNYVLRHYIQLLEIKEENALLMDFTERGILEEKGQKVVFMNGKVDMSLLDREPSSQLETWQKQSLEEVSQFCIDYEQKVRDWGGIGFFIGSLSYGGHLGFNPPGLAENSITHIEPLNYQVAAHAAKDLGGIEHSRDKTAVTIGLGTLLYNPNAVLIIMASGESKAKPVKATIENKFTLDLPATILQKNRNSRFYISADAAKLLTDRKTEDVRMASRQGWDHDLIAKVIIEIALFEKKQILQLTEEDLMKYQRGKLLLENPPKNLSAMLHDVRALIVGQIENGLSINQRKSARILHTGPHHDDVMLGYYPMMDSLTRKHDNHFAYLTSGFNSVSDSYILAALNRVSDSWINQEQDMIFKKSYGSSINKFRYLYVKEDHSRLDKLNTTIILKHLVFIFDIKTPNELKKKIRWLKDDYFPNKNIGDLDIQEVKLLKGMMRESEADRLWSLKNIPLHNVSHFRSRFYSGREFAKTPRFESDVLPFLNLCNDFRPDIITLADDPQSAPPRTHYRVLQIIAQALRSKEVKLKPSIEIWGYRTIWFKYTVSEANVFIPVSEKMLESQRKAFLTCFNTQKFASFPSPFHDGDFASLSTKIQREQLETLRDLLGKEYFVNHERAEIRNATGFIFLNRMDLNKFLQHAQGLYIAKELEEALRDT